MNATIAARSPSDSAKAGIPCAGRPDRITGPRRSPRDVLGDQRRARQVGAARAARRITPMAEPALRRELRPARLDLRRRVLLRHLRLPAAAATRDSAGLVPAAPACGTPGPAAPLRVRRRPPSTRPARRFRSGAETHATDRVRENIADEYHRWSRRRQRASIRGGSAEECVTRIGMGLVGAGFVGPHHVDAVRRLGFVDIVAVAGSTEARGGRRPRRSAREGDTAAIRR